MVLALLAVYSSQHLPSRRCTYCLPLALLDLAVLIEIKLPQVSFGLQLPLPDQVFDLFRDEPSGWVDGYVIRFRTTVSR